MALIQCPHCGKKVSDVAIKCPHCGNEIGNRLIEIEAKEIKEENVIPAHTHTREKKKIGKLPKTAGVVVAVVLVVGIIFGLVNRLSPEEKYQVEEVTNKISEIGEVQLYSGDKILQVEEQYEQLSSKCKRNVKNKSDLKAAKKKWNELEAENVSEQIDAIGEVKIGTEIKLQLAKTAYEKLTDEQKKLVKNFDKVEKAEETLSTLKIENVENLINEIGTIQANKETKDKISQAEQAYNATLTDEERAKVNNYDKLSDIRTQYGELAVQNCIAAIDAIGEVTLDSGDVINDATEAYLLVLSEDKDRVTNHMNLDDATKKLIELQEAEEERLKNLSEGDTFTTNKWEVTYKRTRISAKVLPNNTSGYYQYYYADDDSVYVDMVFYLKNVSSDRLSLNSVVTSAKVEYGEKYNYTSYTVFYSYGNDIDVVYSWDGMEALHSTTLHVAVKLPRVAQTSNESIKATLTIAGEEKIINIR